jgi:hypothetical protein
MVNVTFHPAAAADYGEALIWYAEQDRKAARGFESQIERILSGIASSPLRYPECDAGCREAILIRYPYSVIYVASNPTETYSL